MVRVMDWIVGMACVCL